MGLKMTKSWSSAHGAIGSGSSSGYWRCVCRRCCGSPSLLSHIPVWSTATIGPKTKKLPWPETSQTMNQTPLSLHAVQGIEASALYIQLYKHCNTALYPQILTVHVCVRARACTHACASERKRGRERERRGKREKKREGGRKIFYVACDDLWASVPSLFIN